jgi:hypothetical protein
VNFLIERESFNMSNPYEAVGQETAVAGTATMKLKRVGVMSCGLYGAAAGAIMGLFAGGFVFLISLAGMGAGGGVGGGGAGQNAAMAMGMGVGMMLFMPIIYGIMGFIGGLLNAFVFNVVAGMSGGIEMEFSRN